MRQRAPSPGPLLGAHQSIARGLHRAVERASAVGCEALQSLETPKGDGLAEDRRNLRALRALLR
jgi:hypothetical protein